jgi:hypothetical protein
MISIAKNPGSFFRTLVTSDVYDPWLYPHYEHYVTDFHKIRYEYHDITNQDSSTKLYIRNIVC